MKRVNYDGHTLTTGTAVAEALADYSMRVARMDTSMTVHIPVLESDGTIGIHTLLLTTATSLEVLRSEDGDDSGDPGNEETRFPVPRFPGIGGSAVAIAPEDEADIRPPLAET